MWAGALPSVQSWHTVGTQSMRRTSEMETWRGPDPVRPLPVSTVLWADGRRAPGHSYWDIPDAAPGPVCSASLPLHT